MPIPKPYEDVIALLEKKTAEGNVRWNAKSGSAPREVSVSLEHLSVGISSGKTEEGADVIVVGLYDERGEWIDGFGLEVPDPDHARLTALYTSAKRVARGVEAALQKLKAGLSQEGPVGVDVVEEAGEEPIPF